MHEGFLNETKMKKKNTNKQIFREYFNHQSPSLLVKDLYEGNENKNDIIVKFLNEPLIGLRNTINSKEIPGNESPKKINNKKEKDFLRT